MRRSGTAANDLAETGAELVLGDLRDPASLNRALHGVTTIVATANVVAPAQRGDTTRRWSGPATEVPLRGERHATVHRPYGLMRTSRRLAGRSIEEQGRMLLPGPASNRHALISVHDVAAALAGAVDATELFGAVEVGGPEVLSWQDVATIFGELLERHVQIVSIPAVAFRVPQRLLAPVPLRRRPTSWG